MLLSKMRALIPSKMLKAQHCKTMSLDEFLQNAEKHLKRTSKISEDDIEKAFCKYAKRLGCTPYKLIILRAKGFPDRTVLCPGGRILFIEFKKPKEKIKPTQSGVRTVLVDLGFKYHLCDGIGQAEAILDDFLL